jgi:hypothetical protein
MPKARWTDIRTHHYSLTHWSKISEVIDRIKRWKKSMQPLSLDERATIQFDLDELEELRKLYPKKGERLTADITRRLNTIWHLYQPYGEDEYGKTK